MGLKMMYVVRYVILICYFTNLSLLKKVTLSSMGITNVSLYRSEIPLDTTGLFLGNNSLQIVTSEDLEGLQSLQILGLNDNYLTVFPNVSSVKGTLEILYLMNNLLTEIPKDNLDVLHKLKKVLLKHNFLTSIPDVYGPSTSLITLKVSNNKLEHFPALKILPKSLTRLEVSSNSIEAIKSDDFEGFLTIQFLDLSGNRLHVFPDCGPIKSTLEALDLSNNDIFMIPAGHLVRFENLHEINLINNSIHTVPVIGYSTQLLLGGNPLDCDVNLAWLITRQLEGECWEPASIKGKSIGVMTYHDIGVSEDSHNGGNKRKALGHLVSCDHYYIEMAIVLAKVRSITDCQLTCTSTPGCVFYNYKQSSGSYHCHYSDPLRGQMYTEPPDGGVGWRAYYVVHDLS